MAYPSLYEGFGLPLLEAMACGTPVIASNAASMPEVLGDAGILIDPTDEGAWTDAIVEVLSDGEMRARLREAGLRRATEFTWERTARLTLDVYRRAVARMTAGERVSSEASTDPDVSVIVVTWNGRQLPRGLPAGASEAQRDVRAEIVLVDNGSTDGTADLVRSTFPRVRIVRLEENRGFAGGNNAGAREARGQFLAFLNNDTVPESDWLRRCAGHRPGGRLCAGHVAHRVHARPG